MNLQFNTNPSFLATRLFSPDRPRIGANTYLNVNLLPDFVQYIKRNLRPQELIALSEYQLQTYIMQLSIKEKVTQPLDSFVQKILSYVRSRKQFWINGIIVGSKENQEKQKQQQKHQHEAIIQYQKDTQYIQSKIPNYPQKVFDNKKKRRIYPFMSIQKIDFIDKSKQITKMNLTNYAMMPAYVLRDFLKDQYKIQSLPKYDDLQNDHESLIKTLENAVQYFLMQQKPRNVNKQQTKKREIIRERRLPPHLINSVPEQIEQQQKIDEQASVYSKQSHQIEPLHFNQSQNKNNFNKDQNILQNSKNLKIQQEFSQSSQSSQQQETENKFYLNFHEQVAKKQFYDSKMFSKQSSINQSHNILEILKCLIYFNSKKEDFWFDKKWKQLQQERIAKAHTKKEQGEDQQKQENEPNLQNDQAQNIHIQIQKEKQNHPQKDQNTLQQNNQLNQDIKQKNENNQINQQKSSNQIIEQSQQQSNIAHNNNQQKPEIIQIGIRKPIFDQVWRNPQTWSYKRLLKHLSDRFLTMREVYFVTKQFVNRQIMKEFNQQKQIRIQKQKKHLKFQNGLVDPDGVNLDQILLEFKQMIEHPQNVKLGAFKTQGIKIPWDDSDYLMFLKGLREYFFIPTNNRKIAQFMMSRNNKKNIEANHVKYVKAIYLKNMQVRIDRGESGGGKKGKMQGKTQFIDKDIETFSMRWFDKMKKSKKKLRRRRFDDDDGLGQEADSAY